MCNRGTETEEQIQKRLRNAKGEMEQGKSPGLFDHVLVNDDLDACYENLKVSLSALAVSNFFTLGSSLTHQLLGIAIDFPCRKSWG